MSNQRPASSLSSAEYLLLSEITIRMADVILSRNVIEHFADRTVLIRTSNMHTIRKYNIHVLGM